MKVVAAYDPALDSGPGLQSYSMIIMDMSTGTYKEVKYKKRIRRKMKKSFGKL